MRSVLVISGGGFQGLGLLQALQEIPDVRPIVADIHADNVTRYVCTDYHTVPPVSDRATFRSALFHLIEQEKVEAIFPATARELPLLAELRNELEGVGASVAVASAGLVGVLLDKVSTVAFLRESGLPTQAPVAPATHDFSTGLFGKPRAGWGGIGTVVAHSLEAVGRFELASPPKSMLWFPLVDNFDEYSADFAVTISGDLSPIVLRKRLRTSGGFAVISESSNDAGLLDISHAAATSLIAAGARGIFNMQMIRPPGEEAFISDVNPRFGTSAVHGLAEGVNLAGFFMDGPIGKPNPDSSPRRLVKTVRLLKTISLPKLDVRPKGIVFDLDDTLVDHKLWMAAKVEGAYDAVARNWIGAHEFRLHALQLVDEGERSHLIDQLAGRFSWTEEQRMAFLAAYRSVRVEPTPLFADVVPVLASLKESGFRMAVLTDNPPATQRAKIENARGLDVLSSVVYSRDTGHEKPSPAAYAAAASSLSMAPADLCMVGDNYFRDAVGAISSGYASAIIVKRQGSFLQSHFGLAEIMGADSHGNRIHHVEGLNALREILLYQ